MVQKHLAERKKIVQSSTNKLILGCSSLVHNLSTLVRSLSAPAQWINTERQWTVFL